MSETNEVEGCWAPPDYSSICRKCKSELIECPKEGHANSHFWELKKYGVNEVLKVCPEGCLESDATEAFRAEK